MEDVLTSGLPAKLMRFLRLRVLGESNSIQKDVNYHTESKNASGSMRGKDESRARFRQILDSTQIDGSRIGDEGLLDDQNVERDHDRSIGPKQVWGNGGESLESRELADDLSGRVDTYEANGDGDDFAVITDDRWHNQDLHDEKAKHRGTKTRGRGRINEGAADNDRTSISPGSGLRVGLQGRNSRDRTVLRTADTKRELETKKYSSKTDADNLFSVREDTDDCFQECKVGTRDISELVKKATRAAEAEARAAHAPEEAIKAAGDAAADLVKSAALEVSVGLFVFFLFSSILF